VPWLVFRASSNILAPRVIRVSTDAVDSDNTVIIFSCNSRVAKVRVVLNCRNKTAPRSLICNWPEYLEARVVLGNGSDLATA
jgi:hypothetical protein